MSKHKVFSRIFWAVMIASACMVAYDLFGIRWAFGFVGSLFGLLSVRISMLEERKE